MAQKPHHDIIWIRSVIVKKFLRASFKNLRPVVRAFLLFARKSSFFCKDLFLRRLFISVRLRGRGSLIDNFSFVADQLFDFIDNLIFRERILFEMRVRAEPCVAVSLHACSRRDQFSENDVFFEWIRASASMPVVAQPVEVGGRFLLDGGLADSIPLEFMMSKGYDRNIVILTREEGYRKTAEHGMWLMKHLLRKYPKVVEALKSRPAHYNKQLQVVREQERKGNAFVFRPMKPLDVSRTTHDAAEMNRVYQQGREEALQRLDELKKFLANEQAPTPTPSTDEQP